MKWNLINKIILMEKIINAKFKKHQINKSILMKKIINAKLFKKVTIINRWKNN